MLFKKNRVLMLSTKAKGQKGTQVEFVQENELNSRLREIAEEFPQASVKVTEKKRATACATIQNGCITYSGKLYGKIKMRME